MTRAPGPTSTASSSARARATPSPALLGGLPITGVIVRSSTNVAAGGSTRASAILHGLWIVVFSVALLGLVQQIPMAVLAGPARGHRRAAGEARAHARAAPSRRAAGVRRDDPRGRGHRPAHRRPRRARARAAAGAAPRRVGVDRGPGAGARMPTTGTSVPGTSSSRARCASRRSRAWPAAAGARCPPGADVVVDLVTDYLDHAAYDHLSEWIERHERGGGHVRVDEVGSMGLARPRRAASSGGPGARRRRAACRGSSARGRSGRRDTRATGGGHGHALDAPATARPTTGPDPHRACASTTAAPRASSRRTCRTSPTASPRTRCS